MPLKGEQMGTSVCLTGKRMCYLTQQKFLGAVEELHKMSQTVAKKHPQK